MFDENFTFVSSTADATTVNAAECTSADISPFTSRCSSPKLEYDDSCPPLSHSAPRRDSRFDLYRPPRHPSVTALTAQLEHHAISEHSRPDSPVSAASPTESTLDQDEGFYDGPDTPNTLYSDYSSDFDPSLWDLSMSDLSATSSPRPSLSLEAQAMSSHTQRRRHRQALVRLQCLAKRAPDIAMLIEECHPSSLPLIGEAPWTSGQSRSNSIISLGANGNGRVEKERPTLGANVRKPARMRKRATR
jgi:hypothetical protein